jgi:hypothetical protein
MVWTVIWLMLLLIPIGGLYWIVWWAIDKTDEQPAVSGDDDGGSKIRVRSNPHPRAPRPRSPRRVRRGPHPGAPTSAPQRTRRVIARARKVEH